MLRKLFNKVTHWEERKAEKELLESEWEEVNKRLVEKYFEKNKDSEEEKVFISNRLGSKTTDTLIKERTEYAKNNLDADTNRTNFSKKYYKKLNKKLAKDVDKTSKVYNYVNEEYKLEEKEMAKIFLIIFLFMSLLIAGVTISSTFAMIVNYICFGIAMIKLSVLIIEALKSICTLLFC